MPLSPAPNFVELLKGLQARVMDSDGNVVPSLIAANHEEENGAVCRIVDNALEHSLVAMFVGLPTPLLILAGSILHNTYHTFGHLMFELGRQYEIDGALTPIDVQDVDVDDLKGAA